MLAKPCSYFRLSKPEVDGGTCILQVEQRISPILYTYRSNGISHRPATQRSLALDGEHCAIESPSSPWPESSDTTACSEERYTRSSRNCRCVDALGPHQVTRDGNGHLRALFGRKREVILVCRGCFVRVDRHMRVLV